MNCREFAIERFARGQLPCSLFRSFSPSCRNTRMGFFGVLRINAGYVLPPSLRVGPDAISVKLPTQERTFRNSFGRSHATVHEQIPPLEMPAIARISGSCESLVVFST